MPKVSVCVPSYNYAHYIGECIRSVLSQTYTDWELVVVDNHSSDNTAEVVRSFEDPRIRFFVNNENLGLVRNWNRCVSLASGDYIAILPADDAYLPRMLERSAAMLDHHPNVGFTYSSYHMIDEHGRLVKTRRQWDEDRIMSGEAAVRSNLIDANFAIPPTVLMRREHCLAAGGYDEAYRVIIDWLLYMRIALRTGAGYIAEPVSLHRYQHPTSESAQKFVKKPRLITDEELRLLAEILPRMPANAEWRGLRRQAYHGVIKRHVRRTYDLLVHDQIEGFRRELAYAMTLDHALPLRYRKMATLWVASFFGGRVAKRLDSTERAFWHAFRGGTSEPTEPEGPM